MAHPPDSALDRVLAALEAAVRDGARPSAEGEEDPRARRALALLQELVDGRAGRADEDRLFLESIVENLPDMIFVKDADELRFVRFNRAGEELLGHRREDLLGKNDYDFFPPSEADWFTAKDREVLAGRVVVDIPEEPIHTAKGLRYLHTKKIPVVDAEDRPLFLLGISEDITEQKEAREALAARTEALAVANRELTEARRALEARQRELQILLGRFPGAVWTTDGALRLTSAGGSRAEELGVVDAAAGGVPLDACFPDHPALVALHRDALADGARGDEVEVAGRLYEVRAEPLEMPAGRGVVAVALDLSERRKVEAQRLELRLQQAQKLESLGLLAGGVAHDFNNLLVGILGNASLALMKLPPEHAAQRCLTRIERAAERAADLTRQMLAYSGRGQFVIEHLDLSSMVEEIADLLRVSISKKVTLSFQFQAPLPAIEGDAAQLRQLVMNLITNASDAIGDRRGTIALTTGIVEADRGYLGASYLDEDLPPGTYVYLEVSDTGVGMDAETQRRMFDPFFTTKEEGHGLGLAATLGIIRGHRGAVNVYSEPGRGTTIKVLLPAAGEEARAPADEPAAPTDPRRIRVLVVDDEPAVRELAAGVLAEAGHEVLLAADGPEAIRVFGDLSDAIDVVVLDVTMPRMTGDEVFRALRRLAPGVRVVLSSGYSERDATARFAGKGLAGFLQKPYRARDLLAAIAQAAPPPPDPATR